MSSKGQRDFEDPKIIYTVKLVNETYTIRMLLAGGSMGTAAKHMAILLLGLVITPEEKEMLTIKKDFTPLTYHHADQEEIYHIYETLCDFLNRTYLADFHRARPKFKTEGAI
jgi:hypothetical protein